MVGIALATTVLVSMAATTPSSPATPAETTEAITTIRSGLEPAALLARSPWEVRISGKHREENDRNKAASAALATTVALALGHVVMSGQPGQGVTRRVPRAWAQRAPPVFQHI